MQLLLHSARCVCYSWQERRGSGRGFWWRHVHRRRPQQSAIHQANSSSQQRLQQRRRRQLIHNVLLHRPPPRVTVVNLRLDTRLTGLVANRDIGILETKELTLRPWQTLTKMFPCLLIENISYLFFGESLWKKKIATYKSPCCTAWYLLLTFKM